MPIGVRECPRWEAVIVASVRPRVGESRYSSVIYPMPDSDGTAMTLLLAENLSDTEAHPTA